MSMSAYLDDKGFATTACERATLLSIQGILRNVNTGAVISVPLDKKVSIMSASLSQTGIRGQFSIIEAFPGQQPILVTDIPNSKFCELPTREVNAFCKSFMLMRTGVGKTIRKVHRRE
jgi:hypothetical protein